MSSDRERIIEFDASSSIPADGWFAIDSTTEGTRKIQKSAIIGSGSLDTTSQEVIGAINEVNQRAATVESMTQAEYDALPDTKLSDNVVRYITDGEPTYDETLWNKVGTDPLDTTAQDCSGAINEIKQSLSYKSTSSFLDAYNNSTEKITAIISVTVTISSVDYYYYFSIDIPKLLITLNEWSKDMRFFGGNYANASNNGSAQLVIKTDKTIDKFVLINGTNVSSVASVAFYYR